MEISPDINICGKPVKGHLEKQGSPKHRGGECTCSLNFQAFSLLLQSIAPVTFDPPERKEGEGLNDFIT